MNFKQALHWMKLNPVAVVSVVLCLASLVFLLMVNSWGNTFIQTTTRRSTEINKIKGYLSTPIVLPPAKVDASPRTIHGVVNKQAIDYLKNVFVQLKGDYRQIWGLAVKHNRGDAARGLHLPIIDDLFPDPGYREDMLYSARQPYLSAFEEMLRPAAEGAQYPRLDAGRPVSKEQIDERVAIVTRNLRARYGLADNEQLTPNQQAELLREQRKVAMDLIRQRAQSIHIYASPTAFQVDTWSTPPLIQEIWESQMGLWIQQDIVQTISRTNRVSDASFNVILAPIKRLDKITIVPGYVGINTGGGMSSQRGYGKSTSGNVKLPDDFSIATTGRMSNSLYDIRHVWVDMDVDIQQLPVFMDELVQTNFMTVLQMELTDLNEYDLLNEGYFVGSADVFRVHMLIETLWLRDWTAPMMPKAVREQLGVQGRGGAAQASAQ